VFSLLKIVFAIDVLKCVASYMEITTCMEISCFNSWQWKYFASVTLCKDTYVQYNISNINSVCSASVQWFCSQDRYCHACRNWGISMNLHGKYFFLSFSWDSMTIS